MNVKKYFSGLFLVAGLTILAMIIQSVPIVQATKLSAIIIAIFIGMLVKNTVGVSDPFKTGIKLCSKKVLRLAIILLGFKLSLMEVEKMGINALVIILFVSTATMFFTKFVGEKLKVSKSLALLIASGTSICGASAIVAVNAVNKSKNEEDVAFAIGVVTIFGSIFMILYPLLFNVLNLHTPFYALWAGSSIHEVAQVVAAGFSVSSQAGTAASVVKLTRVLLIIPVTLFFSFKSSLGGDSLNLKNVTVPWFVLMFLGVIALNSAGIVPQGISKIFIDVDNSLMTAAMVALGLETNFTQMKQVGIKPIYLGAIASVFISVISVVVILISGLGK